MGKHFALLQLQCCHLLQPANWNHLTSLYLHLLTAWYWHYILIPTIYSLTYTTENHWGRQKKHRGRRDGPCQLFIRFEELQEVQHPNLACALVELVVIR